MASADALMRTESGSVVPAGALQTVDEDTPEKALLRAEVRELQHAEANVVQMARDSAFVVLKDQRNRFETFASEYQSHAQNLAAQELAMNTQEHRAHAQGQIQHYVSLANREFERAEEAKQVERLALTHQAEDFVSKNKQVLRSEAEHLLHEQRIAYENHHEDVIMQAQQKVQELEMNAEQYLKRKEEELFELQIMNNESATQAQQLSQQLEYTSTQNQVMAEQFTQHVAASSSDGNALQYQNEALRMALHESEMQLQQQLWHEAQKARELQVALEISISENEEQQQAEPIKDTRVPCSTAAPQAVVDPIVEKMTFELEQMRKHRDEQSQYIHEQEMRMKKLQHSGTYQSKKSAKLRSPIASIKENSATASVNSGANHLRMTLAPELIAKPKAPAKSWQNLSNSIFAQDSGRPDAGGLTTVLAPPVGSPESRSWPPSESTSEVKPVLPAGGCKGSGRKKER